MSRIPFSWSLVSPHPSQEAAYEHTILLVDLYEESLFLPLQLCYHDLLEIKFTLIHLFIVILSFQSLRAWNHEIIHICGVFGHFGFCECKSWWPRDTGDIHDPREAVRRCILHRNIQLPWRIWEKVNLCEFVWFFSQYINCNRQLSKYSWTH